MNNTATVSFHPWSTGMTVTLVLCCLFLFLLILGLFGFRCKGGPIWLIFKYLTFACFARCCKNTKDYHETVQILGDDLKRYFYKNDTSPISLDKDPVEEEEDGEGDFDHR